MRIITIAAVLQFLGVALGAFGAHGLQKYLESAGLVETWETAVLYHLVHGLALFGLGIWTCADSKTRGSRITMAAATLLVVGIAAFSGSLYAQCLGAPKWLWPVTPAGGICFLAAWVLIAALAVRTARHQTTAGA